MLSKQPVIVLVPGACTAPAQYRKLVTALEGKSFRVYVPALPTNNGDRPPNSSYEADLAAVRDVVERQVIEGNEVFMIMHSYGGAVGTNAIQGLARKDRQAQDLPGGVVHLMYLCAYLLAKGQSIMQIVEMAGAGDYIAENTRMDEDGTWVLTNPIEAMYHDLDPGEQEEQANQLKPHYSVAMSAEAEYEGWKDIPSTYVRTTEDRCVPPAYQDILVGNAEEAGLSINVKVLECAHSPHARFPNEVAEMVLDACRLA